MVVVVGYRRTGGRLPPKEDWLAWDVRATYQDARLVADDFESDGLTVRLMSIEEARTLGMDP